MRRLPASTLLLLGVALSAGTADLSAQFRVLEQGDATLELGGYVRSLTQLYDLGYDLPEADHQEGGIHAEIVRLKWNLRFGSDLILEVHNRFQAQVASSATGFGGASVGFGVSAVPGRRWDLSSDLVDQERLHVWHDIDRLSLTWYTGFGDLTAGRQAITWGISSLYPVADLWAQFSPFELDTEEKPGVDAVRLLKYPASGLELDAVAADRGSSRNFSAGLRGSLTLPWADLYFGGGKFWREAMALAGISAPVGSYKLRAEGALPFHLDKDRFRLPRVTVGLDWLGGEIMVSGEYNYNGIGATDPDAYLRVLNGPMFARGETYFLGRHNLGGMVNWTPGNDRLALTATGLWNLLDPSGALVPNLTYDFGQETRVSGGALISFGKTPVFAPEARLRSEFGTYGDFGYLMLSVYF
jgi:hypothetical protein